MNLKLIAIDRDGRLPESIALGDFLRMAVEMTARHYERVGFSPPWVGYVAIEGTEPVGICGFKSPPIDGRVEIGYGTVSGLEGRGIATAMARELVRVTRAAEPTLTIFAQTLPEVNASTAILGKLGFRRLGTVEHPEDGAVWEWELPPDVSNA